ncbi:MAG: VWA domain-containing protein, partial [Bacteroidota bacterium]|nr:VWA domain-containing protein [Bacteroidota bacterium]
LEKFIPPKKGKKHILFIIRELIEFKPENTKTDLAGALKYLTSAIKKRCTAFVISDFIDINDFQTDLTIANRKHDVVAVQVYDKRETELPPVGLMTIKDAETGLERQIDASSKAVRQAYSLWWANQQNTLADQFKKSQVDSISVSTEQDYVKALINLFHLRS